jgi:hypothetical protein
MSLTRINNFILPLFKKFLILILDILINLIMPRVVLTIMVLLFLTKNTYNQEIEDGLEGSFEDYNDFYGNF